jgi:four helix bundle protein
MMSPTTPGNVAAAAGYQPGPFPHERLDAYRVARSFYALVGTLRRLPRGPGQLGDHLERASAGVVLQIVEAASRRAPRDQAHLFTIARGSVAECAAVIELALLRGLIEPAVAEQATALLRRLGAMLTGLIASCGPPAR